MRPIIVAVLVVTSCDASAQTATNVAKVAIDAFGEKVGADQIGLYSESQVRGFSLLDSGNYQVDGAYFIRSANFAQPALDGVTIRVGVNALGIDFPAPSGVVAYRTPTAAPGLREDVEFGYRDYASESLNLRGGVASQDDRIGFAYGTTLQNDQASDGLQRRQRHGAFEPHWRATEHLIFKGFIAYDNYGGDGDFATALRADSRDLPPPPPSPGNFAASWSKMFWEQINYGVIARYTPSAALSLQSSIVMSDADRDRTDFTQLNLGSDGTGTANALASRPFDALSNAFETKASWQMTATQRLYGTLRARHTHIRSRPGVSVPLGFVDQAIGTPVTAAPPQPADVLPTDDEIRQATLGVGYETILGKVVRLRGGLLRTQYEKDVRPPGESPRNNTAHPYLYDLAASWFPNARLTLFATAVRGLEESGTAPNNAANRFEVLPAVLATQYELGIRYVLPRNLTFISSLFEISKPTPGLDADNFYGLIGEARHRGIELSLTGQPATGINMVGGLALLQASRLGELVDRGVIIGRAPGVPAVTGLLNLTWDLPFLRGASIDSQLNYSSKRLLNTRTGVYTPQYATLDVGARYSFNLGKRSAVLRVRTGNVFDENVWVATRSETMNRLGRRAYRATLAVSFDH
ncbi:MAG: TonB-dependent receptor [Pseudomonadota bacterium]